MTDNNSLVKITNNSNSLLLAYDEDEQQYVVEIGEAVIIRVTPNQLLSLQNISGLVLQELAPISTAMSGDLIFEISPTTVSNSASTVGGTSRDVVIKLTTSGGLLHEWFNGEISVSISDTSTGGTATIADTTPSMVNGECVVTINYDSGTWISGETVTLTVNDSTIMGYTVPGGTSVDTLTA